MTNRLTGKWLTLAEERALGPRYGPPSETISLLAQGKTVEEILDGNVAGWSDIILARWETIKDLSYAGVLPVSLSDARASLFAAARRGGFRSRPTPWESAYGNGEQAQFHALRAWIRGQ